MSKQANSLERKNIFLNAKAIDKYLCKTTKEAIESIDKALAIDRNIMISKRTHKDKKK